MAGNTCATEVRVGLYENEPKIFTDANGAPSGILVDLLNTVAAEEKWQLSYVPCTWEECLKELEAGSIDLMPDVAFSPERALHFDFHTTPALYSWSQIYSRKGVDISSVLDLKGKRIALLAGGIQESAITAMFSGFNIKVQLIRTRSVEDAFRLTRSGQADAAVASHDYGDFHAPDYQLNGTPIIFQPTRLFYVTAKGRHPELLSGIDKDLSAWNRDPDSAYFKILQRWGGRTPASIVPPVVWRTLGGVSGVLLFSLLGLLFMRKQIRLRTQQLADSSSQLRATLDAIPDLLFEIGLDGHFYSYHSSRNDLLTAPATSFIGKKIGDVLPPDAADICMSALQEANMTGRSNGKTYALSLPQGESWFELSISKKQDAKNQAPRFIVLVRDVTQRKVNETHILRLTKLYAALSQCNQAIVRCSNKTELFPIICRDAVNFGGMKMAWIGILDQVTGLVEPVASYGAGTEYLDNLHVSIDGHEPGGSGPTGIALREDRPFWCQDFANDPVTAVWHERAAEYGWGASASIPLHCHGIVVGTLTLYAEEKNAFDEPARNLLLEMAMDISFALERFDAETERKKMSETLLKLSLAVEQSPNSIVITDLDANIEYANSNFTKVTGYSLDEVLGKNPRFMQSGKTPKATYEDMWAHLTRGEPWKGELFNRRKDGTEYIESVLISPVSQVDGRVMNYLAIKEDITEKRLTEERIEKLEHFDHLTGLPNRTQLNERFKYALSLAQRSGEQMTVMFLDLDHFKDINDTLGHSIGDQLLMDVAKRLKETLRDEDTVSRQGGDEFILILPGTDENGAAHVAAKLMEAVSQAFQFEQHELVATCSIGIAIYPHDGENFETLSKNADTAMYRVKHDGRNGFCFFTSEMQAHSARTLQLGNALRHALTRGQLHLHYQPQISTQDGHVVGAEALLRWQHPELGSISPAEFIPIAEDNGQIIPIGEWVLRTAIKQLKDWMDSGLPPMIMAVNLSAAQFRQSNLMELVTSILDESKVPHRYLELELTEAVAMDDPQLAIGVMDKLHTGGIKMSIDDFGTGYSSLSYLKRFKVYKLKIDQSFVHDITDDPDDKAIVAAIINMASSLGMQTIAEGVETAGQLSFLRLQGCNEVQGYYFSKPLPAEQFVSYLQKQGQ
ncbi:EAL domain-containing protein [Sideroxydans lithotrophicus]|uniref:EAL domain-containing protein n=1 Tax=Sideroxydans lithotrophicus TaxID=63745 RepID=UPI0002F8F56F|nr:EAL domain-containing protein [Sideroxydans lithotrophicus]